MISLIDTIQPDFDRATLDYYSDAELATLQAKTDASIAGWFKQQQPLDPHEVVWLDGLIELSNAIRNTLNRRYGCSD
jgi:hypothetical protein